MNNEYYMILFKKNIAEPNTEVYFLHYSVPSALNYTQFCHPFPANEATWNLETQRKEVDF